MQQVVGNRVVPWYYSNAPQHCLKHVWLIHVVLLHPLAHAVMPSGPGAELPLYLIATSMSFLRTCHARVLVGRGARCVLFRLCGPSLVVNVFVLVVVWLLAVGRATFPSLSRVPWWVLFDVVEWLAPECVVLP